MSTPLRRHSTLDWRYLEEPEPLAPKRKIYRPGLRRYSQRAFDALRVAESQEQAEAAKKALQTSLRAEADFNMECDIVKRRPITLEMLLHVHKTCHPRAYCAIEEK